MNFEPVPVKLPLIEWNDHFTNLKTIEPILTLNKAGCCYIIIYTFSMLEYFKFLK